MPKFPERILSSYDTLSIKRVFEGKKEYFPEANIEQMVKS